MGARAFGEASRARFRGRSGEEVPEHDGLQDEARSAGTAGGGAHRKGE